MFSYILGVYTGYIQSISICSMLKAGTLQSIASIVLYSKIYSKITFKGACKNMVALFMSFLLRNECHST